jgi:hypothetical protein
MLIYNEIIQEVLHRKTKKKIRSIPEKKKGSSLIPSKGIRRREEKKAFSSSHHFPFFLLLFYEKGNLTNFFFIRGYITKHDDSI